MDSCAERADPGDSEQDEEEDVYEVERIIGMRVEDGEILYRVRWKNYSSDDDTWEPKAHLEDCSEVLLAYERSLAEKELKKDPSMMTRFTGEEALQMLLDSEEEFTLSSDEEKDSDEERLYFEERLDPAEDIISEVNVAASLLSSPVSGCESSNETDIHTGNVAATLSPSFICTGARSNATDIHTVNVAATLSPSFDTCTGSARSNENNKENVAASLLSSPSTRSGCASSNVTDIHPVNVSASPLPATHTCHRSLSVLKATETNVFNTDSDNAPVAKRLKTNIQASSRKSVLSWKTETDIDVVPHTLSFFPAREPGPQLSPADAHTPLSLFKMFFPENAVSTLCLNTNAQAARATAKGCKYKWKDVSATDMYRYIGLLFYMAMVKVISIRDYWRQDNVFSVAFPAKVMSRERYCTISWNVHMSHPEEDKVNDRKRGTAEHDRLFRVKPLMDTIRQACINLYHPKRNLAVDERMVACKANTGMTQYMTKPTKWGFKLFVLADSSNGYTVDFSVYTGKNNFPTGHGLSYDAVMSLLDCKTLGSGYHVYMDNFYTSPKLLTDLFAMRFGACGTYRDFRKECPRDAANSLSKQSARGSIRWIRNGPLLFVKWMDTREVSVCSTIHPAYTGETVQRRVKSQDTWSTKTFPCPAPVTAYNQHMGGVDLSAQLKKYYTAQHKTMKWYRKIFLHFLDIAATNAFIMHKELCGIMTHKQFMEQLVVELCGITHSAEPKQTRSTHVPVPVARLTSDVSNTATAGRRKCVRCKAVHGKRRDTPWKCKTCNVPLCVQLNRNCFEQWHDDI